MSVYDLSMAAKGEMKKLRPDARRNTVAFRTTNSVKVAIEDQAAEDGMQPSEWLDHLVRERLAAKLTQKK